MRPNPSDVTIRLLAEKFRSFLVTGPIGCHKCPMRFGSKSGLGNHVRMHGGLDVRLYKCDKCDFSCGTQKAIRFHRRSHVLVPDWQPPNEASTVDEMTQASTSATTGVKRLSDGTILAQQDKKQESSESNEDAPTIARNESAGLIKRHINLHTNVDCLAKDENTMDSEDLNEKLDRIGNNLIESIEENKALLKPRSATRRMNGMIACPSSNCQFVCRFANELIRHKRLVHGVKLSSKTGYECAMCGIKFATFGQRMIHLRTTRHHKPRFNSKMARKFLKEIIGNRLYKANVNDLPRLARVKVEEEKAESQTEQEQKEEMPKIAPEPTTPTTPSTGNVKEEILDEEMAKDPGSADSLQATFPCNQCPYLASSKSRLKRHEGKHLIKSENQCPRCTFSCRGDDLLATHIRLHTKDGVKIEVPNDSSSSNSQTPPKLENEKTNISLESIGAEVNDERMDEDQEATQNEVIAGETQQEESNTTMTTDGETKRHLCPSLDATQCSTCNYASVFAERLEIDETLPAKQQKENTETPQISAGLKNNGSAHICNECPFATETYGRLWNHKEKHKKQSKFNCEHCTFSTGSLTSLHQHARLHGAQMFECRIAGCSHAEVTFEGMQKHYETRHCTSVTGLRKRPLLADVCLERLDNGNGVNTPKSSKSSQSPDLLEPANSDVKNEPKRDSQSPPDLGLPFTMPDPTLVVKYMRKNLPPYLRNLKLSKSSSDSASPESSLSSSSAMMSCSDLDCPYEDDDPALYRLHADMHGPGKRPMACTMCTYSCFAPEALYNHLDLHTAGHDVFKKITSASARRLARESEIIMEGAPVYSCIHCSYRTQFPEKFKQHRIEHAVSQQNRLKALVKRNARNQEDDWTKPRLRSLIRKSDRELYCPKCGFYCVSKLSYDKHVQMHGTAGYFTCKLCDYSSNTYNVVHFHEINHHLDQPLTHLTKAAILHPETSKISAAATTEDRVRLAGQEVRCNRCDWRGCEVSALSAHFSSEHGVTAQDQEAALFLYLGLFPKSSVLMPTSA